MWFYDKIKNICCPLLTILFLVKFKKSEHLILYNLTCNRKTKMRHGSINNEQNNIMFYNVNYITRGRIRCFFLYHVYSTVVSLKIFQNACTQNTDSKGDGSHHHIKIRPWHGVLSWVFCFWEFTHLQSIKTFN